jgi:hypothetical protein
MPGPKQELWGDPLPQQTRLGKTVRIYILRDGNLQQTNSVIPAGIIEVAEIRRFGKNSCQDQYSGAHVRVQGRLQWVRLDELHAARLVH